jgi:hypothetical protein
MDQPTPATHAASYGQQRLQRSHETSIRIRWILTRVAEPERARL